MANAPETKTPELIAVTNELCSGRRKVTIQATDDPEMCVTLEGSIFPVPVARNQGIRATVQHFSSGATRVMCPMLGKFHGPNGKPADDRLGCMMDLDSEPVLTRARKRFGALFPDFRGEAEGTYTPVCLFLKDEISGAGGQD